MEVKVPLREVAIFGVVLPIEKHWESLLRRFIQEKSITATAELRQPRAMLQTCRCHITLSPVNNSPLRCGFSSKFFNHLLLLF